MPLTAPEPLPVTTQPETVTHAVEDKSSSNRASLDGNCMPGAQPSTTSGGPTVSCQAPGAPVEATGVTSTTVSSRKPLPSKKPPAVAPRADVGGVGSAPVAGTKRAAAEQDTERPAKRTDMGVGPVTIPGSVPSKMPLVDMPGNLGPDQTATHPIAKADDGPVYFWRPTGDRGWMSQWYDYPMEDPDSPGLVFQTAEHFMMYRKALTFKDVDTARKIVARRNGKAIPPARARELGRGVKGFDSNIWANRREAIVEKGTWLKVTRPYNDKKHLLLKTLLLATGDRELVEASPSDRIWGIGFEAEDAGDKRDQWGLNLLGKSLMAVRSRLRADAREALENSG